MGTLINCLAILIAGILGTKLGERIPERMRDTILKANGAAVIALGLAGFLSKALIIENGVITSTGTMNMIFSMCLGSAVGSWIDLEAKLEQFGEYLKQKTGNKGDMKFTDAFMTASLTVCIGAMAIVGAIEDGINGDMSILLSKAILDFVIILVFVILFYTVLKLYFIVDKMQNNLNRIVKEVALNNEISLDDEDE